MADKVMTVLGPISTDEMGVVSAHEHLVLGMPGWEYDTSYQYDRSAALEKCLAQVNQAKGYGLQTFIDATPMDLARDPELMKAIQRQTGVNVICSTGLYTELEGNNVFWRLWATYKGYDEALKRLSHSYIKDITEGIGDSSVKCGVIKVATGKGQITKLEELSIHAAAIAQKETGVPVISHTAAADMGPATGKMMLDKGMDPKKTMVGHLCDTDDLDCVEEVLKMGLYVGLDRFGLNSVFNDEHKCKNLCRLIEKGYIDQILIGHDSTIYNHVGDMLPEAMLAGMPDWNMSGLFRTFIPRLKELGLTDEHIKTLMVTNPKRFFEGK